MHSLKSPWALEQALAVLLRAMGQQPGWRPVLGDATDELSADGVTEAAEVARSWAASAAPCGQPPGGQGEAGAASAPGGSAPAAVSAGRAQVSGADASVRVINSGGVCR